MQSERSRTAALGVMQRRPKMSRGALENPYTKRAIKRRIEAALAAGLRVVAVQADGTIVTEDRDNFAKVANARLTGQPKLRDARELLR
jgi:hypothetical protein